MHRIPRNPKHGARLDMVPEPFDLNLPRPLEHVVDLCLRMLVQSEGSVRGTGRNPYAHGVGAGARLGEKCLPDYGAIFRVWERAEGCLVDLVPIEDYWWAFSVASVVGCDGPDPQREQPDLATHRPHPRSSKYLLYQCPVIYAMGSNVDTYFPVQRIAQACLQCRRKKCRCTGDRPVCGQCGRLNIDCVYPVEAPRRLAPRQQRIHSASIAIADPETSRQTSTFESSDIQTSELVSRIGTLEAKIESMGSSLQRIERCLVALVDGSNTNLGAAAAGLPASSGRPRSVSSPRTVGTTFQPSLQNDPAIEDFGMPEDVLMAVVDSYFTYCQNQPYSFFHEDTFRQGLAQNAIPKHLVLAVMATTVRFCSHPYYSGRALEMSVEYANRSWKLIVSDCFTVGKVAEVSTVQTVALLGLFDFTAGRLRHGSAWVKVGLAVRIAQDCGLMLENAAHLSYAQQEERRRVFWSVYLLDRLVSCGRGRPPAIVDASCHLQMPCDESIWREGLGAKTQSLDEMTNRTLSISQRQCPLAQVIAIAQILGRCAQYVLQDFNIRGPHPPWDPGSDFAGIESDLLHFEAYLEIQRPIDEVLAPYILAEGVVDSQSSGPIIFSRALFHLCYCLLNHPFLLRRRINTCRNLAPISFIKRSSDMAWLHAQQMMALIRESRKLGCSFHASSSGYAVTVAGSIIALRTYDEDSPTCQEAQILLEEALGYLDIIGHHWSNASTLRQIVYDGFSGRHLNSLTQGLSFTPEMEEAMWALVDYNTMSNQLSQDAQISGQESDALMPNSWIDLFGPIDYALLSSFNGPTQDELESHS
ncbi:zn 2cys6 transcription factor [Fusarium sp. NRRL 25303]|nr:zn 2cys6 transcription factor [Fusarium sp. NRRL 25303]